jgi:hypothetical protein
MANQEKTSESQRNPWSPEDRRLLIITFAGSLAAIIAGAVIIGSAIALARILSPGSSLKLWALLLAFTGLSVTGLIGYLRKKELSWSDRAWLFLGGLSATLGILILVGLAAGIK